MAVRVRTLIVLFKGEASSLQKTINDIGKAKTPLDKINKAGKAAFTVLAGGALAAGAGMAFAVKSFGDFDSALNESIAIMGNVSDSMRGQMSDAAREVAKTTTFSAKEAASAFYFLASSGMDAEQSIAALPQVAQFAQAGMFDLETATDLLVNSQIALGLNSKDAGQNLINLRRVSDVLTEANNEATGSVQDFAEALTNKAATAMKTMNIEVEEGTAVLAAFAQKGIKGQVAGEKLAILLRDTARAAVRNKDEFHKFGVEVFDQNGNLKDLAEVVRQFETALGPMSDAEKAAALESMGMTRAVGDVIRTLMGSSGAIATYEENFKHAGGATEEVANKQLKSFNAQMTLVKNQLMDVAIEIGSHLVPKLLPLIAWFRASLPGAIAYAKKIWEDLKPTIMGFAKFIEDHVLPALAELGAWFAEHPAAVEAFGAVVLGVLVALAVAFVGLKVKAIASMAVMGAKMIWLGIQALAMGAKMLAGWIIGLGPIAWIIAGIIALGILIYVFRDQIMDALNAAWSWIKSSAAALFGWLQDHWQQLLFFFAAPLAIFVALVMTQWEHIKAFIVAVYNVLKEVTEDFWFFIQGVWNVITVVGVAVWHAIRAAATTAWSWIMDRTEGARLWIGDKMVWLRDKIGDAWAWVQDKVGGVWDWIMDKVDGAVSWIGDRVEDATGWIGDLIDKLGSIPGAGVFGDVVGFFGGGQSGMIVPKYAMGGIAGDTVPAMLKPGEMVLNRRQQTSLFNSLNRGGGWSGEGAGGDTYVVEINNPVAGSEEQFERMVVNAIKRAGSKGRPITIRGRQL